MRIQRPLVSLVLLLLWPGLAQADVGERAARLNEQAVALFQEEEYQRALLLLREALELAPELDGLKHNASRCLIALGDQHYKGRRFNEAARDYHEASTLYPEDPEPVIREGQALYEARRDRDLLAVLEYLVQRHAKQDRAHELLARAYHRLGEIRDSLRHWERVVELRPEDKAARESLAQARRDERLEGDLVTDLGAAHFSIKYRGEQDAALGRLIAETLEDAYTAVGNRLGRYPEGEIAVIVYPGQTFQAATGAHGWVAGLYDGKIKVPAAGLSQAPAHEVRRVLTHEFAHALVRSVGGPRVPVWLQEGFAQVAEGRSQSDARRQLTRNTAPPLAQLARSFTKERAPERVRLLYAAACDLVHFLLGRGGPPLLAELLDRLGSNEALDDSLRGVYGQNLQEIHQAWLNTLG